MNQPVCLFITALDLSSLQTSVHGIFQRLRSIVEAYHRLGYSIRIAAPTPVGSTDTERRRFEESVERQVADAWGFPVNVCGLPVRRLPALPRPLLRLLGALRLDWGGESYRLGGNPTRKACAGGTRPQAVVAHRLNTFSLALEVAGGGPVILDLDDIEHRKLSRTLTLSAGRFEYLLGWLAVRSLRRSERDACRRAATTLVCSEDDAGFLREAFGGSVVAIPNAVAVPALSRVSAGKPVMMMVGIYSYGPNADAAAYFVREVFPSVRARVPDAEAWFIGRGGEILEREMGSVEGVRFLGFQPDLAPLYAQSRLAICPIKEGGGTRIKIIEAAAHGLPCVSTTIGAEGLAFDSGSSILIADDAGSFSEACVELLLDRNRSLDIGKAAYSVAKDRYSRQVQLDTLVSVLGR